MCNETIREYFATWTWWTGLLFNQAVEVIMKDKRVSTSYIQRKLQIGYNRAARIIEEMEEKGIISEPNSQGKREILKK